MNLYTELKEDSQL